MTRAQSLFAAGLVALALFAFTFLALWMTGVVHWSPGQRAFTPEEVRALIHTKNVGLGQLENQRIKEGLTAFDQIALEVPDDPLGPRNVAVARVLALGINYEPAPEPQVAAAKDALAKMLATEGETTDYHWLALRAALAAKDYAGAGSHLDALAAADADDPAAWYARFEVGRITSGRQLDPAALDALAKAYELRPTNSWLLVEWLRATASQLNDELDALPAAEAQRTAAQAAMKARFARLPEQLAAGRATTQAFAQVIQAINRVDVLALLDQAIAAAQGGQWQDAVIPMMKLGHVMAPHSVLDQQAVRRHPLEFVLDRFQPQFYSATNSAEGVQPPAIDVSFAPTAAWQIPAELVETLGPVVDFALADFDLDGRLDVIALSAEKLVVWSRKDDPAVWQEVASAATAGYSHLVVQDLDADFDETRAAIHGRGGPLGAGEVRPALPGVCPAADVDIVLYGQPGVALVENRFDVKSSQRSLVPVAADKLPAEQLPVGTLNCADLEADGDLDLALATTGGLRLWRNNGEWRFADMSAQSALPEGLADVSQILAFDWDRDVDIDLLVASPSGGGWLENQRHGQFRWQAFAAGLADLASSQALEMVDADGNATWDLLAAKAAGLSHVTIGGPPLGAIRAGPVTTVSDLSATRLLTWDYDNDGWEDCLAWSADSLRLLRGLTDNKFEPRDLLAGTPQKIARADAGDFDADGDQDLALLAGGRVQIFDNQGGNKHHWIDVGLQAQQVKGQQATPSGRVSPLGVGSVLELKSGDRYQARVVRGQRTHFGLGPADKIDVIRVGWLNGVPQNIVQPAVDLVVCEQQVLHGSCPYLYAWDGEKFVFVTDLLWNAPIGLQLAEGQLAPWRDWEYVKIPGQQMAAKDGHYVLQATAELWEADYFDHVRLIAVDHPAEVEIYSNEKVGPPQIAQYKIHTASQPRTLVAARNNAGRDLLPEVVRQDGVYAKPFERKLRHGVTEEHYIELDLGDVSDAAQVTLFLTGWVYPAPTSLNVGLSQGGSIAPPQPPSLEIPDGAGGWKTALPFMGFPGGKTKTIAVELAEHVSRSRLPGGTLRLRIRTSMEFYWDHIFFTVDEPPAEVRTTELALVSADLHERGFSRVVRDESNGPEQFLYDEVSRTPKWPPMLGNFTRYGDVRELLTARDDRLLVVGAGDETTLRFAAIDPPPAGWKRDFLLYSVGWDKDANLETVLGQSSEPLPFEAMSNYPWPAEEGPPDSPEYREYLRTYQTRQQSPAYWKSVRHWGGGD